MNNTDIIFNKKWFNYLIPKNGCSSLLSDSNYEVLENKFLISYVDPKNYHFFSIFDSIEELFLYQEKFPETSKCFFEIIFGQFKQKPHFDIDIDRKEIDSIEESDIIKDELISSIINVCKEKNMDIILDEDILLFTSHGDKKFSFHLIIDNYYHLNNNEAKEFYNKVKENIKEKYRKYIDSVYSVKQQFRLVYSQKRNSNRIKIFVDLWKYKEEIINYKYNKSLSLSDKKKYIFERSLVSNIINCKEFIKIEIKVIPVKYNYTDYVTMWDVKKALKMYAEKFNIDVNYLPFKFLSINEGLVLLTRIKASFCNICKRVHENENPFFTISGENKLVYYNCRRNNKSTFIGNIISDEEMIIKKYNIYQEEEIDTLDKIDVGNNDKEELYKNTTLLEILNINRVIEPKVEDKPKIDESKIEDSELEGELKVEEEQKVEEESRNEEENILFDETTVDNSEKIDKFIQSFLENNHKIEDSSPIRKFYNKKKMTEEIINKIYFEKLDYEKIITNEIVEPKRKLLNKINSRTDLFTKKIKLNSEQVFLNKITKETKICNKNIIDENQMLLKKFLNQ